MGYNGMLNRVSNHVNSRYIDPLLDFFGDYPLKSTAIAGLAGIVGFTAEPTVRMGVETISAYADKRVHYERIFEGNIRGFQTRGCVISRPLFNTPFVNADYGFGTLVGKSEVAFGIGTFEDLIFKEIAAKWFLKDGGYISIQTTQEMTGKIKHPILTVEMSDGQMRKGYLTTDFRKLDVWLAKKYKRTVQKAATTKHDFCKSVIQQKRVKP